MASRFKPLIKAFGPVDGLKFYIHLLFKKYGSFTSSRYNTTFHLRSKTTDKYTFKQVFLDDQYNVDLPQYTFRTDAPSSSFMLTDYEYWLPKTFD